MAASDIDLVDFAKEMTVKGEIQEALLCLEAAVQRDQKDSEAWRLLGELYSDNADDKFAILSLKNAHEADPKDLRSLFYLGIMHINEEKK